MNNVVVFVYRYMIVCKENNVNNRVRVRNSNVF